MGLMFPISGLRIFALAVSDQKDHREKWGKNCWMPMFSPHQACLINQLIFPPVFLSCKVGTIFIISSDFFGPKLKKSNESEMICF